MRNPEQDAGRTPVRITVVTACLNMASYLAPTIEATSAWSTVCAEASRGERARAAERIRVWRTIMGSDLQGDVPQHGRCHRGGAPGDRGTRPLKGAPGRRGPWQVVGRGRCQRMVTPVAGERRSARSAGEPLAELPSLGLGGRRAATLVLSA